MKPRLLAEIAAALLVTGLLVTLAWWWNRPAQPDIPEFKCPAPVELVTPGGSALWCGDDQLPTLLERLESAGCENGVQDVVAADGAPLRLFLAADCKIKQKLTSLSPTVLSSLGRPLDLNNATAKDLTVLSGIGPKLAAAIVADRTANGPFCSIDDLSRVKGIGPVRIKAFKQADLVASCAQ